ncbi:hypothetical protein [Streptomyces sp. AA1529]|uniref:hypothetical protein n=1 Tax=Streptomyces sp. AA1529 TaxID=1203257 RepID=UPI003D752CD6
MRTADCSNPSVLTRPPEGTEAVSVWHPLAGSAHIAHARDGVLMAGIDTWHVYLTESQDVSHPNRALDDAGFFRDDEDYEDDWTDSAAALMLLEREFGLKLSPQMANGALAAVSLQHLPG